MVNINKIWRGFKNNLARKVDLLTQNQGEIVDELNKKVDKITSANKVYITSSTGGQEEGAYSKTNATANTFAMRGSNGVLVVGTPTADNHAATKKYVDDNIEANPTATGEETRLERIKIGNTSYIVGGGAQPTLYAPTIIGGTNQVSWVNNTNNGAFGTVVGTIDDTIVTSPLTITEQLDGKTLVLTCSETDFNPSTSSVVLSYITGDCGYFANKTLPANTWFGMSFNNTVTLRYDNVDYSGAYNIVFNAATLTSFNFTGYINMGSNSSITIAYKVVPSYSPDINSSISTTIIYNKNSFSELGGGSWSLKLISVDDPSVEYTITSSINADVANFPSGIANKAWKFLLNVSFPE